MKLRFTNHAQYRIGIDRLISIEDVKHVINYPDKSKREDGVIISSKKIENGNLEVVYIVKGKEYVIVTTYYI